MPPPPLSPSPKPITTTISLGLSRITPLIDPIPQPWKAIHIAGTNGKGSIAFYLSHLLARSGIPCGVFTSPHLIHPRESIKLSPGYHRPPSSPSSSLTAAYLPTPISKSKYTHLISTVRSHAPPNLHPSDFEVLTAAAFRAFSSFYSPSEKNDKQDDGTTTNDSEPTPTPISVAIIECGMGGLRDATNALPKKSCTILTSISLDHQSHLGTTLPQIAKEKAGIMRHNIPCFAALPSTPEVQETLQNHALEIGAPLTFIPSPSTPSNPSDLETQTPSHFQTLLQSLPQSLLPHQKQNIILSLSAFTATCPTEAKAINIPDTLEYLSTLRPPGRLQHVRLNLGPRGGEQEGVDVLLDGAHNPESAAVLGEYVSREYRSRPDQDTGREKSVTWIVAASQGRELKEILGPLLRADDNVHAVGFPGVEGMPWVKPAEVGDIVDVATALVGEGGNVRAYGEGDHGGLLRRALRDVTDYGRDTPIVVAGSLYLVSHVLEECGPDGGEKY